MGYCQYQYNPSEIYRRTAPGGGVETSCGGLTHPAIDEPELVPVDNGDGTWSVHATGRYLARSADDPYCPVHGGTPEPEAIPVSMAELEASYAQYAELAQRFQAQPGGAITAAVPAPAQLAPPPQAAPAGAPSINIPGVRHGD